MVTSEPELSVALAGPSLERSRLTVWLYSMYDVGHTMSGGVSSAKMENKQIFPNSNITLTHIIKVGQ